MRRALALAIVFHLLVLGVLTVVLQKPEGKGPPVLEVALRQNRVAEAGSTAAASAPAPQSQAMKPDAQPGEMLPAPTPARDQPRGDTSSLAPAAEKSSPADDYYTYQLSKHMLARPFPDPRNAADPATRNLEGTVVVGFRIDRAGNITSARVSASSGNELLDKAALDAVLKRSPVPRPPADMQNLETTDWFWSVPFSVQGE